MRSRLSPWSSRTCAAALVLSAALVNTTDAATTGTFQVGVYDNEGYTLVFEAAGHFQYLRGERLLLQGEFRTKGDEISLTDLSGVDACKGEGRKTGRYRWRSDDEYLSFEKIQDSCNDRVRGVAGRWKQRVAK